MWQKKLNNVIVFLGFCFFSGCQKESEELIAIKQLLVSFMNCNINFPERVVVVEKGTVMLKEMPVFQEPVLVYFMGSKDCFECEIAHLQDLIPIFRKAEKDTRFQVIIILAPEDGYLDHVLHDLNLAVFPYPIYVSLNSEWARQSGIPGDPRFHTFLLDENKHPCLVGDPLSDKHMMKLFNKTLKNH